MVVANKPFEQVKSYKTVKLKLYAFKYIFYQMIRNKYLKQNININEKL